MSNQTTIYDSLMAAGFNRIKRHTGEVGIEIETESKRPYEPPKLKFWSHHPDGSLRDFGIEYILEAPVIRGRECRAALEEWDEKVRQKFTLVPDSFSTSVHVHVNFLNNSWIQLANFLTLYYSVENLLIRISGPDRLSNLFCLPLCDAEGELAGILSLVSAIGSLRHGNLGLSAENYKYAALNLCNLTRLGTLEIRSLRGTTDIKEIDNWVEILLSIKDYASQKGLTPPKIIEDIDRLGERILNDIFGDRAKIFERVTNKEKLIRNNLYYAAKIAGCSRFTDSTWGFPKPKKVYKEKLLEDLNQISQELFSANFKELMPHHKLVVEEMLTRRINTDIRGVVFANGDE